MKKINILWKKTRQRGIKKTLLALWMWFSWKKALASLLIVGLLISGYIFYTTKLSPTSVAFVNFRDFQMDRFASAKDNSFISVERIPFVKGKLPDLSGYSAAYFFGMGLRLTEKDVATIRRAMASGVAVYVYAATSKEADLTNLSGDDLDYVAGCFKNGGRRNFRRLLNYTRRVFDGKTFKSESIKQPVAIPSDIFFYTGDGQFFPDYRAYQKFYKKKGKYKKGAPKVCVLTSNSGPRNSSIHHLVSLINALEKQGFNVYPIASFIRRMDMMQQVNPDLVVALPHGSIAMGRRKELIAWCKKRKVPILAPINVHSPYEKWAKSQFGMRGGLLGQSIVVPEIDGAIAPFSISAKFKNSRGFYVLRGLKRRMDRFASYARKWVVLKRKKNRDKKIAIYYFKGPGLNSMVAGGLEVAPSLLNLLRKLKRQGYTVGPLPANGRALHNLINKKGPILGSYAKGRFKKYLKTGDPALVPVKRYLSWVKEELLPDLYAGVEKRYGPAPGPYMSVSKKDGQYLAVTRIRFGNVVLLPQPMAGYGDNSFKIVHGAKAAPPHPYIASYLWARRGFKADAMIHFGTHGSLEFTPWKQVALSDYDWPDVLVGDLPHLYVYVINNIGEAMMAKRRSYAVISSHMTPPFMRSELYGRLIRFHDLIHNYKQSANPAFKQQTWVSMVTLAAKLNFGKALGVKITSKTPFDKELFDRLHNHIHALENAKVTRGLYQYGRSYTRATARETAGLMAVDAIAYSFANMDVMRGTVRQRQLGDSHFFDNRYRSRAQRIIRAILYGGADPISFVPAADLARLKRWEKANPRMSRGRYIRAMVSMMLGGKIKKRKRHGRYRRHRTAVKKVSVSQLKPVLARLMAEKEANKALLAMKNPRRFARASALLKPANLKKARRIARFVKPMREQLDLYTRPQMTRIIRAMQNAKVRKALFGMISDPGFLKKVAEERVAVRKKRGAALLAPGRLQVLLQAVKPAAVARLVNNWPMVRLRSFAAACRLYLQGAFLADELKKTGGRNALAVAAVLRSEKSLKNIRLSLRRVQGRIWELKRKERLYVYAVRELRDTLKAVRSYVDHLSRSAEHETSSLLTGLDGGYIAPSSGGDPIANPSSVPTGRNLYAINAEKAPSPEAWKVGKKLARALIQARTRSTGKPPRKVGITLWGGEFIRGKGTNIAQILYLLGVEPVRNSRGVVHDIRLIPVDRLKRARVDVLVQTSGQFRDLAASRIFLINRAVRLAAKAKGTAKYPNYVNKNTKEMETLLKKRGFSPEQARMFATARVFGGVNGNYGTGIMGLVESGDKWKKDSEIADRYIKNMGAIYTKANWGYYKPGIFRTALTRVDSVVQPRSSSVSGPLSLDHVYEFMGGLNLSVKRVTGREPTAYFNDLRNRYNPRVQGLKEAIWVEASTTLYNPKYIKALQKGGASSAEKIAEAFRNTYGWNVMKPGTIDKALWDGLYQVYIKDKHKLGIRKFFNKKNPYALQEMTAVMLETIRKGYWKPGKKVVQTLSKLHAKLVVRHKAGCSGFVCDNKLLRRMIGDNLDKKLAKQYSGKITEVRSGRGARRSGMRLKKTTFTLKKVIRMFKENIVLVIIVLLVVTILVVAGIRSVARRHGEDVEEGDGQ